MIANRLFLFFCGLFLDLAIPPSAYSQTSPDSGLYRQSLANLSEVYNKDMAAGSRLYTGSEYLGNGHQAKGSPFFLSDSSLPGSVIYQGQQYDNLDMQYDLLSGAVLIKDYTHNYNIELTKEKVTRFSIAHHEFWYLVPDRSSPSNMEAGYYERLNTTGPALFARREKKIVIPSSVDEQAFYQLVNSWYLFVGGQFYKVESKNRLLDILKDKKDLVKKIIREQHLNFKKEFERALIKTVESYAQQRN
jgi:hypothetical protein